MKQSRWKEFSQISTPNRCISGLLSCLSLLICPALAVGDDIDFDKLFSNEQTPKSKNLETTRTSTADVQKARKGTENISTPGTWLGVIAKEMYTCEDCPPPDTEYNDPSAPQPESRSYSSSSNSNRSSPRNRNGVKEYYDGGYKSSDGHRIYRVKCNSGRGYSAFQKRNGYWYDSGGSNYGDRYRHLSISEFAQKKCGD